MELGSFSAAARAAGVTPQATSRAVARLEHRLDVELFRRSTRSLEPTEAARVYHRECRALFERLDEVESRLGLAPAEVVRMSVPTSFGTEKVLPLLPDFRSQHPHIELEVDVSNRNVDFVKEGFDLAIRQGRPADGPLIVRNLGDHALALYASPDYLARRGQPGGLAELDSHDTVAFVMPSSGRVLPWLLTGHAKPYVPNSPLRVRHDIRGLSTMAAHGAGIVQTYRFIAAAAVARGELVEVNPAWGGRTRRFCLLYPRARRRSVQTLVRYLASHLAPARR